MGKCTIYTCKWQINVNAIVLQLENQSRQGFKGAFWLVVGVTQTTPTEDKPDCLDWRMLLLFQQTGPHRAAAQLLLGSNDETFSGFRGFIIQKEGTWRNQNGAVWVGRVCLFRDFCPLCAWLTISLLVRMCGLLTSQTLKHLVERRRRERINRSLDNLKSLLMRPQVEETPFRWSPHIP